MTTETKSPRVSNAQLLALIGSLSAQVQTLLAHQNMPGSIPPTVVQRPTEKPPASELKLAPGQVFYTSKKALRLAITDGMDRNLWYIWSQNQGRGMCMIAKPSATYKNGVLLRTCRADGTKQDHIPGLKEFESQAIPKVA